MNQLMVLQSCDRVGSWRRGGVGSRGEEVWGAWLVEEGGWIVRGRARFQLGHSQSVWLMYAS